MKTQRKKNTLIKISILFFIAYYARILPLERYPDTRIGWSKKLLVVGPAQIIRWVSNR